MSVAGHVAAASAASSGVASACFLMVNWARGVNMFHGSFSALISTTWYLHSILPRSSGPQGLMRSSCRLHKCVQYNITRVCRRQLSFVLVCQLAQALLLPNGLAKQSQNSCMPGSYFRQVRLLRMNSGGAIEHN